MPLRPELAMRIAQSKATAGNAIIRDGVYLFEILKLLIQPNRKKEDMFIAEMLVRRNESTNEVDQRGMPVVPNAVGSSCSYSCNLVTNESADGNVKAFVLALVGIAEEEITYDADTFDSTPLGLPPDPRYFVPVRRGGLMIELHRNLEIARTLDDVTQDSQPYRGAYIADVTYRGKPIKSGKNAGQPFVGHNWAHVPNQTDADINERRRLLDNPGPAAR